MRKKESKLSSAALIKHLSHPKYRGKHIVAVGGEIFTARTGKGASELVDRLIKKYPRQSFTISYIPKIDALVVGSLCRK